MIILDVRNLSGTIFFVVQKYHAWMLITFFNNISSWLRSPMNTTAKSKILAHINKNTQHTLIFRWAWSPSYKAQMLNMLRKSKGTHTPMKAYWPLDPLIPSWPLTRLISPEGWQWGGGFWNFHDMSSLFPADPGKRTRKLKHRIQIVWHKLQKYGHTVKDAQISVRAGLPLFHVVVMPGVVGPMH